MENSVLKKYDGLDALLSLFEDRNISDDAIRYKKVEDALIEHIVEHTLFFDREMVRSQARDIRALVRTGQALPARFTSNTNYFLQHAVKTTTPRFKNVSEAVKFTKYECDPDGHIDETKCLFHRGTKIRVKIDAAGNYAPKCTILRYTGHRVSWGQISTVVNYTIAHIWAKTDNPLFFNSLWNYALLPTHCTFITDKRDDSHHLVKRVKDLIRAISWELYDPNRIMDWNQKVLTDEEKPSATARNEAKCLIKEEKIQFLPKNESPVNDLEIPNEDVPVDAGND